jgi:AraC-like DNA-binding protein
MDIYSKLVENWSVAEYIQTRSRLRDSQGLVMPNAFTSIATFSEAIARTVEKYQVDSGDMFASIGMPREPYRDPDSRIPIVQMSQIWAEAERLTGNPCLGFEVGMGLQPTNFHAVGYAWLGSASIREALERLVRYQRLLSTAADMTFENKDTSAEFHFHSKQLDQFGVDAALCAVVQVCRGISHEEFSPLSVSMTRPAPVCEREVAQFLNCTVEYQAHGNVLTFSSESIDAPLPRNNPAMVQASEELAQQYIARMDKNDIVTRARVLLIGQLPNGEPSRKLLAERLHMSERTLARRLSENDYTFTSLVDEIRQHLARDYLRQSRFSVTDVAFLLGFSDQSNFARAFKRWTDLSPTEFRLAK